VKRKNNNYSYYRWSHGSKHRRRKTGATLRLLFSKGFIANAILAALIVAVGGVIFVGLLFIFLGRNLPDPNALQDRSVAQSTKIFDRTGEHLLYEIHGDQKRTLVPLSEIPSVVSQAFLSAEDDGFYEHNGIDLKGIARAVLVNTLSGDKSQGASTLTQQLVKNAILSPEKTYTRKIKEIILSIKIEQRYSKDEILQLYFNEIPFGSTNYGIESASQSYFGKSASELDLAEGATLAAMVKAPTRYMNNPDELSFRRDRILDLMVEDGFVTQGDADIAKASDTSIDPLAGDIVAPHFVFYVKQLLEEEHGQRMVEEGGLSVITTIDYDIQVLAQEEVAKAVEERGVQHGFSNAALVAIDPENGQVLAMVGSHDYFDEESDGAVNVTTRPRQPGSSMKPMAYTALFEAGYTPNTVLYDVETDFPTATGTYHPRNYDLGEKGPVTVRKALQGSLNIPAVKALYLVGVQNFIDFAERMGYSTFGERSRFGLSVVLGGGEVTLLEHTSAYATLANDGVRHPTVPLLKIETPDADVLFEWEEATGDRVLDANIARTITNVLSDDAARHYAFGGGSNLQIGGRPVASKTGTTNDYRDGWTLGYTPSLAIGVWGGNNDNTEMVRGAGGSTVAAPIWNAVMRGALSGSPVEEFSEPEIPQLGKPALDGTLGSGQSVTVDRVSGLLATEYTPTRLRENKTFVTHHSLLYYVDRGDITGAIPGVDATDPMFTPWESAVQAWVVRQQEELGEEFVSEEPPTDFDDVHLPQNVPNVSIETPIDSNLESRVLTIEARVSARREVERVEFFVDGYYLGQTTVNPYRLTTTIPSFVNGGQHTLKVVAFDDVENEGQATMKINVPGGATGVQILDPRPGQTIVAHEEAYTVGVQLQDPSRYSRVDLYLSPRSGSGQSLIGSILEPSQAIESFQWKLPVPGEYILAAVAVEGDNGEFISAGNIVLRVEAPQASQLVDGEIVEEEAGEEPST
jgi:penicillin-binding protein 1C